MSIAIDVIDERINAEHRKDPEAFESATIDLLWQLKEEIAERDCPSSALPPAKPPSERVQRRRAVDEAERNLMEVADRRDVAMHKALQQYRRAVRRVAFDDARRHFDELLEEV